MKSVRIFNTLNNDNEELVYEFRRPSQNVVSKGELVRRTKFSEALRAGVVINAEVIKILKERGLWGDEQEEVSSSLRDKIDELEKKLRDPGLSNDDGILIVTQIKTKRLELENHQSTFTTVVDATCESIASEERNMFYAAECIYNKTTGQKVYKDLEDFKSRLDERSTLDSYREASIASLEVLIGQDLPSDLSSRNAENQWLDERGLNKSENTEDVEETEEKVESEKPKLKTRRYVKKATTSS